MVILLRISRHTPENCPIYSEEFRKKSREMIENYLTNKGLVLDKAAEERDKIAKKHGIKEIGGWFVTSEHLIFSVIEAPNIEAYQKFENELQSPMIRASTTEIKIAISSEEVTKMMLSESRLSESEKHILQKIIEWFL